MGITELQQLDTIPPPPHLPFFFPLLHTQHPLPTPPQFAPRILALSRCFSPSFLRCCFSFFYLLVAHSLHDWLSVGTDSNIFNCLFCFSFCPCPTPAVLHYLPQSFLTLTSASSVLPSCSQ